MLRNVTRKKTLVKEVRPYASFFAKGFGLMFRCAAPQWAVLFPFSPPRRVGIHMWFVWFALDILWLDNTKRVLHVETLRPFSMCSPPLRAAYVLELPAGLCSRTGTDVGDLLEF